MNPTSATRSLVMALALCAGALAPSTAAATPLRTRSERPLRLSGSHGRSGWSVVLVVAVLGGAAALVVRGRRQRGTRPVPSEKLDVLRRQGLGLRAEIVVVRWNDQRLLLGVTPHGVQTLAVTPDAESLLDEPSPIAARFESMLALNPELADPPVPTDSTHVSLKARPRAASRRVAATGGPPVEEQLRGLLRSGPSR